MALFHAGEQRASEHPRSSGQPRGGRRGAQRGPHPRAVLERDADGTGSLGAIQKVTEPVKVKVPVTPVVGFWRLTLTSLSSVGLYCLYCPLGIRCAISVGENDN